MGMFIMTGFLLLSYGRNRKYVLLDFQKQKGEELEESAAKVVIGNEFKSLREVSSLVSMLS